MKPSKKNSKTWTRIWREEGRDAIAMRVRKASVAMKAVRMVLAMVEDAVVVKAEAKEDQEEMVDQVAPEARVVLADRAAMVAKEDLDKAAVMTWAAKAVKVPEAMKLKATKAKEVEAVAVATEECPTPSTMKRFLRSRMLVVKAAEVDATMAK